MALGLPGFAGVKSGQARGIEFSIDIVPSPVILVGQIEGLAKSIRSFRAPLERSVKEVVIPSIKENFDVSGRPRWPELSTETEYRRGLEGASTGIGAEILVRTNKLKNAATAFARWQFDREKAWVGNDFPNSAWYGPLQQNGFVGGFGTVTPPRPFMLIQPNDATKIDLVFETWLSERLAAAGFK